MATFLNKKSLIYAASLVLGVVAVAPIIKGVGFDTAVRILQTRDGYIVVDPNSHQRVLVNELALLGDGQDVPSLVKQFGGTLTVSVPQTNTYQAKFRVKSLTKLDRIASKFQKKGVKASYVVVSTPLHDQ
jgi:hypothetical protein